MCSATEVHAAFDAATVGILGFMARDGTPRSCAVTPYVDGDSALVTSTLAYLGKVTTLQHDRRVAMLASGAEVRGDAALQLDLTAAGFDRYVRAQELAKFPPSRSLLRVPFHRRIFWWYVGRAFVRVPFQDHRRRPGPDRVTLTVLDSGRPSIHPLDPSLAVDGPTIAVGAGFADGPVCLLVHDEDDAMDDLRQLTVLGDVRDGVVTVRRRRGSLVANRTGSIGQLRELRTLARAARVKRPDTVRLAGELAVRS